jgi:hypothetical protein
MNTIFNTDITIEDLENSSYKFQPELTFELDNLGEDFNQEIINQIVLWKVNRFSPFDDETLLELNQIKKNDLIFNESLTRQIMEKLLNKKGIQLAMASTILRFKNPNIYQIIDQRVYRFIYGDNLPGYFSSIDKAIDLYIKYLEKLRQICKEKEISFKLSDRILYELDKKYNKDEKIKY